MATTNTQNNEQFVLGWAANKKKTEQFFGPFVEYMQTKKGIKCVNVINAMENGENPENDINIFFVKLSDDFNDKLNPEAQERVRKISEFCDKFGDKFVTIEPFDVVAPFMDRKLLHKAMMKAFEGDKKPMFRLVPSIEIACNLTQEELKSTIEENKMIFPMIIKTVTACGVRNTHHMTIIFNIDQLYGIISGSKKAPQVFPEQIDFSTEKTVFLQSLIPHSGCLFKTYVIDENSYVQMRPSLKTFSKEEIETLEPITFDSQKPFPEQVLGPNKELNEKKKMPVSAEDVSKIFTPLSNELRRTMRSDLFGYDMLVDESTGEYFIVDINYFPLFSSVDNLYEVMYSFLKKKHLQNLKMK